MTESDPTVTDPAVTGPIATDPTVAERLVLEPDARVNSYSRGRLGLVAFGCLLVVLIPATQVNWSRLIRNTQYELTGAATINGATYYLNPDDKCFTPMVLESGHWGPMEAKVIRSHLKEGDCFIDVGANIGWFTIMAAKAVGPTGKVIAFEPDPTNFAYLKHNIEANELDNVVAVQKALSDKPGTLRLNLHPTNLGMHSVALEFEGKSHIDVEAVRLDDYLKETGFKPNLIKIDTEGAECLILAGMPETLRTAKLGLILEFAPDRYVKTGHDGAAVLRRLGQDYKITVLDQFANKTYPLPADQIGAFSKNIKKDSYLDLFLVRE